MDAGGMYVRGRAIYFATVPFPLSLFLFLLPFRLGAVYIAQNVSPPFSLLFLCLSGSGDFALGIHSCASLSLVPQQNLSHHRE